MNSDGCRVLTFERADGATEGRRYGELRTAYAWAEQCGEPQSTQERISTGLEALDRALGGGFRIGAVHELLAPVDGAAVRTVALLTALSALGGAIVASGTGADCQPTSGTEAGRYGSMASWLLYVDSSGDFCPVAAARLGLPLERVIVLRARSDLDVLWVCEQALRCPGVVLVASPRRLDAYASRRLQLAAETGGTLGLILREDGRAGHTFAESRVRFEPVAPAAERLASPFPPPRLMRVEVVKLRGGRLPGPFVLELPEDARGWEPSFGNRHGWPSARGVTDSPQQTELGRAARLVSVHAVAAG